MPVPRAHGGALHHLTHPSRPDSPDPVYWVTPRHLAGDDDALAERIGDTLAGLGWRMWPTARHTLLYVSRDELRGAEWILAAYPFELGGLPVAWQLSVRPHVHSAMTEWNAYFTTGVPYEALADLLFAIDAREAPDVGFTEPEMVLNALGARGWIRDVDRPTTTAMDPGFASSVSWRWCRHSSRTPTHVLICWAGRRGQNPSSAPRTYGAPASAPASRMTWSPRSPPPSHHLFRCRAAPCPGVRRASSPLSAAADDPGLPGGGCGSDRGLCYSPHRRMRCITASCRAGRLGSGWVRQRARCPWPQLGCGRASWWRRRAGWPGGAGATPARR